METEKFENAFQFLSGYFHQDFGDEFGTPEIAVRKFIEDNDAITRVAVVKDLREIVANFAEPELDEVAFELGCYYVPLKHRGLKMKVWLDQVIEEIDDSLKE